jgi:hypothetical protein
LVQGCDLGIDGVVTQSVGIMIFQVITNALFAARNGQ